MAHEMCKSGGASRRARANSQLSNGEQAVKQAQEAENPRESAPRRVPLALSRSAVIFHMASLRSRTPFCCSSKPSPKESMVNGIRVSILPPLRFPFAVAAGQGRAGKGRAGRDGGRDGWLTGGGEARRGEARARTGTGRWRRCAIARVRVPEGGGREADTVRAEGNVGGKALELRLVRASWWKTRWALLGSGVCVQPQNPKQQGSDSYS